HLVALASLQSVLQPIGGQRKESGNFQARIANLPELGASANRNPGSRNLPSLDRAKRQAVAAAQGNTRRNSKALHGRYRQSKGNTLEVGLGNSGPAALAYDEELVRYRLRLAISLSKLIAERGFGSDADLVAKLLIVRRAAGFTRRLEIDGGTSEADREQFARLFTAAMEDSPLPAALEVPSAIYVFRLSTG
ncbi:MAG: hypothetical protein L6Q40_08170, partial [Azonexus sp.]|nr:hypothetical protein [Azonexus sp.]